MQPELLAEATSQFPVNCSNFTIHQFRALNLTRTVTASVCLVIILLIVLLLFFYKAYKSTLQRLFFHLSIVTLLQEMALVMQMEHLWQYPDQKTFCTLLGFFITWTGSMVYLFTFQTTLFLMYKVYEQFRGELFPGISQSRWCRSTLEICFALTMILFPVVYLWVPFSHGNFGLAGAWCWMRTINEDCISVGFVDQLLYVYILVGGVNIFSVVSTLVLAIIFCRLARNYTEIRHQHWNRVKKTLVLMAFLIASVLFDATEIIVRLYTGFTRKREHYALWVAYAVGPPISKLAFPMGFLVYLYSLKKFRWVVIKKAAHEWKSCFSCSKCCTANSIQGNVTGQGGTTAPSSHPDIIPSTTVFHPPYTDEFTVITDRETQPLVSHHDTGYSSVSNMS